ARAGTWTWNGSDWKLISPTAPGLDLVYWKDLGGLLSPSSGGAAWRWDGANWIDDGVWPIPSSLPAGVDPRAMSIQIESPQHYVTVTRFLDEANGQVAVVDSNAETA